MVERPRNARNGLSNITPIFTRSFTLAVCILQQLNSLGCARWSPTPVSSDHSGKTNLVSSLDSALTQNLSALSVSAQERATKDAAKKAAKAEAASARESEKLATSTITIKRIERNKRKYVTTVTGLEAFGLELKKCAKDFGKKFATGSSVTKIPGGGEEITVQGDVSDELLDFLITTYKQIPEDNVECVEDKKKKAG